MTIIAKNIEMSNVAAIFKSGFFLPDTAAFVALYAPTDLKGGSFVDDPVLRVRVFEFPALGLKYVFEHDRFRLEETAFKMPAESGLAKEAARITAAVYSAAAPVAYGFNYDVIYRFDSVIPQREIMAHYLKSPEVEQVKNFGWQYTLEKNKGQKRETYFFKVVSPIELRLHANHHFNRTTFPTVNEIQAEFEKCYTSLDLVVKNLAF